MTGPRLPRGPGTIKQSVYFSRDVLAELEAESNRIDRPVRWIVYRCVRTALREVQALPSITPSKSLPASAGASSP